MQNKLHQGDCHMGGARKGPAQVILAGAVADGDDVVGRLRLTDLTMRGRGGEAFSRTLGSVHGRPWLAGWPTCWNNPRHLDKSSHLP